MARYLLNHRVYYDDEKCTLNDKNTPDELISLGATASRCLQILISASGEVVAKKKLLHEAWEKFGAVVADGSMWQVVSQLRKAFELVELDSQWIINVPRIGYKISQELHVESLAVAYQPQSVEHEEESLLYSCDSRTVQNDRPLLAEVIPVPSAVKRVKTHWRDGFSSRHRFCYSVCIGINLLVVWSFWALLAPEKAIRPFNQSYTLSHREDEIEVWVHNPHTQKESASGVDNLWLSVISKVPEGNGVKYVYVNSMPDISIRSYFFCHKAIDEKDNGCTSAIYIDKTEDV